MMDRILRIGRDPNADYTTITSLLNFAVKAIQGTFGSSPRQWPLSAYGPLLGLIDGAYRRDEWYCYASWLGLAWNRLCVWTGLNILGIKKRVGYNDFLISRWALSGDEETAQELISRSRREDEIGCTLCWALRSLSKQYPEFAARFEGQIPNANPEHMLKNAPKNQRPDAVLWRSQRLTLLNDEPAAPAETSGPTETGTQPTKDSL